MLPRNQTNFNLLTGQISVPKKAGLVFDPTIHPVSCKHSSIIFISQNDIFFYCAEVKLIVAKKKNLQTNYQLVQVGTYLQSLDEMCVR